MTLVFEGGLDARSVSELIDQLEVKLNSPVQTRDTVTLYFSSTGGDNGAALVLLSYLAENQERIILVGYQNLYSNGFMIFEEFPGKKYLLRECRGMIHQSSQTMESRDLLTTNSVQRYNKDNMAYINNRLLARYQSLMTPAQLKDFKAGGDVWFTYQRMLEIFPAKAH